MQHRVQSRSCRREKAHDEKEKTMYWVANANNVIKAIARALANGVNKK